MARLNPKFWDKIANKYAKTPVEDQPAYEKKLKITRQYMGPDMVVAEFGCGTGSTSIAHAPFVQHIYASDLSENMLAIARQKAVEQNITNVTFSHSTIEQYQQNHSSLDMVMTHSLLHLLKDKEQAIKRIFNMLKPGGIFVSSTTCITDQWMPKLFLPIGNFLGLLPLVNFFSPQHLLDTINNAGFEIEQSFQSANEGAIFIVAKKPTD